MSNKKIYSEEEAIKSSKEYFQGDELAANVFVSKYALRDNDRQLLELTPADMHRRIAKEFARIEAKKFDKPLSEDKVFSYLKNFERIIPQGSPMYGIGNPYQVVSLSNCFVAESPLDSYGGILHTDHQIAQVSKRRGGVGTDISHIRPSGTPTRNAARSSTGIIPFLERFSNTIREVGQSGRRGALLTSISIHHPEVVSFATIKRDLKRVTGSNISIRLTDEFLNAVEKNEDYEQRWPVSPESAVELKQPFPVFSLKVSARKVWNEIVENAHFMAEPGILFWDNIIKYGPSDCYADQGFRTISTNPCLTGDTKVYVADGRAPVTFRELAKEGKSVDVYCLNNNREIVVRKMISPRLTLENVPVYEILLQNGATIRATANHKFKLKDGSIKTVEEFNTGNDPIILNTIVEEENSLKLKEIIVWGVKYIGNEDVFNGTVEEFHNYFVGEFKEEGKTVFINTQNCGELPLPAYDSCRLLCNNLYSYVRNPFTSKAEFDFSEFFDDVVVAQRLMDDLIDLEIEAVTKIIEKIKKDPEPEHIKSGELEWWKNVKSTCERARRTGTGITALGDALAALGVKYGSKKSIEIVDKIYKSLKYGSYLSSIEMAKEIGPFEIWDHQKEKNNEFLLRFKGDELDLGNGRIIKGDSLLSHMKKHGRRNIACNTTAPTGSVSLMTRTTSGIEPLFLLSFTRRKKVNPDDKNVRVDFVDQNKDSWQHFLVCHPKIDDWLKAKKISKEEFDKNPTNVLQNSPWWGACARDLDWISRVKMQAAAQFHVDHSISSTVNVPEDITVEKIQEIYEAAWKTGCKGITVYRENCRTGVLIEKKDEDREKSEFKTHNAPKRPKELPCDAYRFKCKGKIYVVFVGLLNGRPYEVFAMEDGEYPKLETGKIQKVKRGHYRMISPDGDVLVENIQKVITPEEGAISRLVSTSLRHGADVSFVVHQCEKVDGGIGGFTSCMARALKKYIQDGTKVTGEQCQNCPSTNLIRNQGCVTCADCGWSKC